MLRKNSFGRKLWTTCLGFSLVMIWGGMTLPSAHATLTYGFDSVTINSSDVGDSFTATWNYTPSGDPTLSATGIFTVDSFSNGTMDLGAVIKNTTPTNGPATLYPVSLMSIGISAPGATASLLSPGSVFSELSAPGNFPGGFKNINACVYAGNSCNGGPTHSGLQAGSSDSFTTQFILTASSVTLSTFAAKFQTGVGSFEMGATGPWSGQPVPSAPEPSALWLFGTGLFATLGLFLVRRRNSSGHAAF